MAMVGVVTVRPRTQMDAVTLSALKGFPQQLEAHYGAVPAGFRHWAPPSWDGIPSEPLTAIEQVCHVRDVEVDGYHVRFHRTLNEVNPMLGALDTEALARERCYGTSDAAAALGAFRAARLQTVELISRLTPERQERSVRRLRARVAAEPGALSVQPRPAASCGFAVAAWKNPRESRLGAGLTTSRVFTRSVAGGHLCRGLKTSCAALDSLSRLLPSRLPG